MPLKYNNLNTAQKLVFDEVFTENYKTLCQTLFFIYSQTDSLKETLIQSAIERDISPLKIKVLSVLAALKRADVSDDLVLQQHSSIENKLIDIIKPPQHRVRRNLITSIETDEFWHELESAYRRTISFAYSASDLSKIILQLAKVEYISYQRHNLLTKAGSYPYRYSQELALKVQIATSFAISGVPLTQILETIKNKENAFAALYDSTCQALSRRYRLLLLLCNSLKYISYLTFIGLLVYQQSLDRPSLSMQYWKELLIYVAMNQLVIHGLLQATGSFTKNALHTRDQLDQDLTAVQEQLIVSLRPKPAKFISKLNRGDTEAFIFISPEAHPTPYVPRPTPTPLVYRSTASSVSTKKLPKALRSEAEPTPTPAYAPTMSVKFSNGMVFNPAAATPPQLSQVRNASYLYTYFDKAHIEASGVLTPEQINRFDRLISSGMLIAPRSRGETGIKPVKGHKYIHDAEGNVVPVSYKAKICGDGARVYAHVIHSEGHRERLAYFTAAESAKAAHR